MSHTARAHVLTGQQSRLHASVRLVFKKIQVLFLSVVISSYNKNKSAFFTFLSLFTVQHCLWHYSGTVQPHREITEASLWQKKGKTEEGSGSIKHHVCKLLTEGGNIMTFAKLRTKQIILFAQFTLLAKCVSM